MAHGSEGTLATEVETLGLTKNVTKLKAANERVKTLMFERNAEDVTKVAGALRAARLKMDEAYENLVQRLNALAVVDSDHNYTAFIDTMIQQIVVTASRLFCEIFRASSSAANLSASTFTCDDVLSATTVLAFAFAKAFVTN